MKKKGGFGMGGIGNIFKQMQNMQQKIGEVEKQLENSEFRGSAGGGEGGEQDSECICVGNGKYDLHKIQIGKRFVKIIGDDEGSGLNGLLRSAFQNYFNNILTSSSEDVAGVASEMGMSDITDPSSMKMDFSNLNALMKQMQSMQKKMVDAEKRLSETSFSGVAGEDDRECHVTGNGKYRVSELKIGSHFSSILGADEAELLGDLIIAAVHDYCKKVKNSSSANIAGMASGMGLPMDMLGGQMNKLLGTEDEFE